MIVESLKYHLANTAGIAAINERVWPHWIPLNAVMPAISYRMDADDRQQLLDGVSTLKTALMDVECWSDSYLESHQLADAVEAALVGHTGTIGASSPLDVVDHIRLERKLELAETDSKLYRISMQFFVAYY
jgi:hypothetical protein